MTIDTLARPLRIGLVALLMSSPAALADEFPAPTGDVILTVSGAIEATNVQETLQLDAALMASLPQHSFTTSTIWTEGTATYTGVLLRDLLDAVGATGETVTLTALNDYQISMPTADAAADGPLLANLADGAPMSVRDKGPVWMLFPYDEVAAYRSEQTYARSIWQLTRIDITD